GGLGRPARGADEGVAIIGHGGRRFIRFLLTVTARRNQAIGAPLGRDDRANRRDDGSNRWAGNRNRRTGARRAGMPTAEDAGFGVGGGGQQQQRADDHTQQQGEGASHGKIASGW